MASERAPASVRSGPRPELERLVLLHGFTQNHHHWHRGAALIAARVAARTGRTPTCVLPDLPGHGLSSSEVNDLTGTGREVARLAGPGTYIGYSMGGRIALHAALAAPELVRRLVLIGATPGIADPAEREARRVDDHARADRIEAIGVAAFLDEWLAAPLFATLPPDPAGRAHRLRNTASGLASSLRSSGTGDQAPLWADLPRISAPTLVLAGELDGKFTAIGREMAAGLPHATFVRVPGAGHAAHSEQPDTTATLIADWLAGT